MPFNFYSENLFLSFIISKIFAPKEKKPIFFKEVFYLLKMRIGTYKKNTCHLFLFGKQYNTKNSSKSECNT